MIIINCPYCKSEIALMESEEQTFDIDCDCGAVITAQNYKGKKEKVND